MSTETPAGPQTLVLIHGLWTTPRIWEHWIDRFEQRDYRVVAPAYPGFEVEVEALREDPSPIESVTVPGTLEHLERVVSELPDPAILVGHGFGGTLVQILLDRGVGAAGVAIASVATEGAAGMPASALRSVFPVLRNPANRHRAVGFTAKQFHHAFTNTLDEAASAAVYDRYHVPAPGGWVWDGALANLKPGHQATWVHYDKPDRAPLLFIGGGKDQIVPAAVNQENADRYGHHGAHTDYLEFADRDHYTIGAPGWEEVATAARMWAIEHEPAIRDSMAERQTSRA
jgi:pimeloyl-ACP methyl ester carboxylesterase